MAQATSNSSNPDQYLQAPSDSDPSGADASNLSHISGELRIADLSAGPGLTDHYDEILLKLCDTSAHVMSDVIEDCHTHFCHHIRHALNADTAYLCNRASLSVVTTSSANSVHESCEDTGELHSALAAMISDLWNCKAPLCAPVIKVFADEPCYSYHIIPLDTLHDHLLIIVNADTDKTLIGDYLADALSATYVAFLEPPATLPASSVCTSIVLDKLHTKYQISSKKITQRRLELFSSQLKDHAVEFEGLSLASRTCKADALSTKLPESLYTTALLWGDKFKTLLDCHALIESSHGYKTLCDDENLSKFSDSRALKIRVHAESLSSPVYIDKLQELTEKSVIHASRLKFSVIPQAGKSHTNALKQLQERFGISGPAAKKPSSSTHSIADEFDLMQINGIKTNKDTKKRKDTDYR